MLFKAKVRLIHDVQLVYKKHLGQRLIKKVIYYVVQLAMYVITIVIDPMEIHFDTQSLTSLSQTHKEGVPKL